MWSWREEANQKGPYGKKEDEKNKGSVSQPWLNKTNTFAIWLEVKEYFQNYILKVT